MSIASKTILIISSTLLLLVFSLYLILSNIMLSGFSRLEEQESRENITRTQTFISHLAANLNLLDREWSDWDDTYEYIADSNHIYEQINLTEQELTNLQINLLVFVNNNGQVVFGTAFDRNSQQKTPVPDSFLKLLNPDNLLLSLPAQQNSLSGILSLPGLSPLIIVSRPILTSQGEGPMRGALIMGKYLDLIELKDMEETIQAGLSLYRVDSQELPSDARALIPQILANRSGEVIYKTLTENTISVYSVEKDIYDNSSLLLKVTTSRDIYMEGQTSLKYLLFSLILLGAMFELLGVVLVKRFFLNRLTLLSKSISKIGALADLSVRLEVKGKDELSTFARVINQTFQALEYSQSELKDSEQRYRQLVELSPDGIIIQSQNGINFANKAAVEIFNFTNNQELIGKTMLELAHPDSRDSLEALARQIQQKQTPHETFEIRFMRLDRKMLALEIVTLLLEYNDNPATLFILRDITPRKEAENALLKRELYHTALIEVQRLLLSHHDNELELSKVLAWLGKACGSRTACIFRNLQDSKGQLFLKQVAEWGIEDSSTEKALCSFQNGHYAPSFSRWEQLLKSGQPIVSLVENLPESERQILNSQGFVSILALPLIVNGKFYGFMGFDSDEQYAPWEVALLQAAAGALSLDLERREAEEKVVAEKDRLAVTLESLDEGVIKTDLNGMILLINKSAESIIDKPDLALKNLSLSDVFSEPEWLPLLNLSHAVIHTGERKVCQTPLHIFSAGVESFIEYSIAPLPQSFGTVMVLRDVTERQKQAEEMQRASKLEGLGILAGGIAHDFNNLLTAILSSISLVMLETEPESDLYTSMEVAEKASVQARNLIHQLLTFARGGEPIRQTASLIEIIRDSSSFALRGSNVQSVFTLPEDLWHVLADKGQLGQVIQNLVINGVQAMPGGGVLRIEANNLTLPSASALHLEAGQYVEIIIKDHGIGISKENLAKIFDPYFTTKRQGHGLGLAICYSILKKHKGQITVESELGKGTPFHLYLPASSAKISAPTGVVTLPILQGKGRVLVLEDEVLVQKALKAGLSKLGYQVEIVADGLTAIQCYQAALKEENPFGAVIMDLTIPGGMGGKEAVVLLREIDCKVKAIVSSGYSEDPIMANYLEYGFVGRLAKPYRLVDLGKILQGVFQEQV
ncbi:MAG: PAS domain S-box protein [Chloroflexi bacterium]|uniref:histidine kinase n=1 Tax=Candidatus Chlorohelix allophototropha TaxID=3003348 RepID=A0A8T7M347_9CHLR|nr:PAS domain S-box protein [Chloroflexota bacterium]